MRYLNVKLDKYATDWSIKEENVKQRKYNYVNNRSSWKVESR